jgi:GntR family transcriptional regulator
VSFVPLEPIPAKYAAIASALQRRIDNGAYPVGAMLPSEAQLVREFAASRSTVVRALEYLRQLGYIEGVQGKGRMVLGQPLTLASQPPGRVRAALHAAEAPTATLIGAGQAPASTRIAATLAIPDGELVIARQRLIPAYDPDRLMLSTIYLPAAAADGTAFHRSELLREGALDHLERRRQFVATDVIERLSVRPASTREATLLTLDKHICVLTSLLIVRSAAGRPLLVVDLAIAVPSQGLEDIFKLR